MVPTATPAELFRDTTATTPHGLPVVPALAEPPAVVEQPAAAEPGPEQPPAADPFAATADPVLADRIAAGLEQLAALVRARPELAHRLHWHLAELTVTVGAAQLEEILEAARAQDGTDVEVIPAAAGTAGGFDRQVLLWADRAVALHIAAPLPTNPAAAR